MLVPQGHPRVAPTLALAALAAQVCLGLPDGITASGALAAGPGGGCMRAGAAHAEHCHG